MTNLLFAYSECATCNNAKKWLESNHISFDERDIKENPPTKEELRAFAKKAGLSPTRFFNTSGVVYREMNLKEKVKVMTEEEIFDCLASDGMLVKRPLFVTDRDILFGFHEEEWKMVLK